VIRSVTRVSPSQGDFSDNFKVGVLWGSKISTMGSSKTLCNSSIILKDYLNDELSGTIVFLNESCRRWNEASRFAGLNQYTGLVFATTEIITLMIFSQSMFQAKKGGKELL